MALVVKSIIFLFNKNGYQTIECSERKFCQMVIEAADHLGEVKKKVSRLEEPNERPKLSRSSILTVLRKLEESGIIKDNVLDADELYRRLTANDAEVIEDLNEVAFEELNRQVSKYQAFRIKRHAKEIIDGSREYNDKIRNLRYSLNITYFEAWALIILYAFGPKDMVFTKADLNTLWTMFRKKGDVNKVGVSEDGTVKDLSIDVVMHIDWEFFISVLEEPFPDWVNEAKSRKTKEGFRYWASKFRLFYNWKVKTVCGESGIRDGHTDSGSPWTELKADKLEKIGIFMGNGKNNL